ncbi:hypothetical protein [Parapedomonas caeni]
MTLAEFRELLDTYGAQSDRWPDAVRTAALALLQTSDDAKDAFAQASALDAVIRPDSAKAPAGLVDAIIKRTQT